MLLDPALLQPLVVRRRAEYDAAVAEEVEWRALLAQVDALQAHRARHAADGKPLKMLADVGAGYRQHARVDDVSKISVDIGLGIYVELSLAEATVFASKKAEVQARVVQGAKDELLRLTADLAVATAAVKSLGSS